MDKLLAPTKDDQKSLLRREYRQRQEQMRKSRIFNPRARLIGIDKNSLDQHVQEKQHKASMAQKEEMCYAMELRRHAEMIDSQMKKVTEEELRRQQEINQFRSNFQRKEQSREFDLNDPLHLQKVSPYDDLDWLGVDPDYPQRIKLQKEQQKSWLQQQICEKNESQKQMNDAERITQESSLNHDTQLKEQQCDERKKRQQIQMETARFNLKLAQEQRKKRTENRRREEEDNLAEIMNNLSSCMLTENKEPGTFSLFGGKRISSTLYRGMNDEELREIRQEQLRQIAEKNLELAKLKESDAHFDETVKNRVNLLEFDEQNAQQKRQQSLSHQNSVNAQLLEEQKQRNRHLESEVYKFTPSEEYYDQFNTTTR